MVGAVNNVTLSLSAMAVLSGVCFGVLVNVAGF